MTLIDRDSLLRLIEIRRKWHEELDVDEILELIREAPEIIVKDLT